MQKKYHFIWPENFHENIDDITVSLLYHFKDETFTENENYYKEWVGKMLQIVDRRVAEGVIQPMIGLERKQQIVHLLNSASIISNLAVGASNDLKINLYYAEFERFLTSADLTKPISAADDYNELISAISILGQFAFLGAVGAAILAKNSVERDYSILLRELQRPYLKNLVRQYDDELAIINDKFSLYETAVNLFNENRSVSIKERLALVYREFGLEMYLDGGNEVLPPCYFVLPDGSLQKSRIEELGKPTMEAVETVKVDVADLAAENKSDKK